MRATHRQGRRRAAARRAGRRSSGIGRIRATGVSSAWTDMGQPLHPPATGPQPPQRLLAPEQPPATRRAAARRSGRSPATRTGPCARRGLAPSASAIARHSALSVVGVPRRRLVGRDHLVEQRRRPLVLHRLRPRRLVDLRLVDEQEVDHRRRLGERDHAGLQERGHRGEPSAS